MVKCYDLIEKHQVNIFEILSILDIALCRWLSIAKIIIREISHKTAGKGRKIIKFGTSEMRQYPSYHLRRIICLLCLITISDLTVDAGYLKDRIEPQESISSPLLISLCRLEHIGMIRYILQDPYCLYGSSEIR